MTNSSAGGGQSSELTELLSAITSDKIDEFVALNILNAITADKYPDDDFVVDYFVEATLDVAERKDPKEKIVLWLFARSAGGDIDDAARRYEEVVASAPADVRGARLWAKAGLFAPVRPLVAIDALRRIAEAKQANAQDLWRLGGLLNAQKQFAEAERWLQLGLCSRDAEERTAIMMGLCESAAGAANLSKAMHWFEEALKTCGSNTRKGWGCILRMAELAQKLGDLAKSDELAQRVLGLCNDDTDPDAGRALFKLVANAEKRKDWSAAEHWCNRLITADRKSHDRRGEAVDISMLGDIAKQSGNRGRAEALQKQALKIYEEESDHWGAADALDKLADLAGAANHPRDQVEYIKRSIAHCEAAGYKEEAAKRLNSLAGCQQNIKDYAGAELTGKRLLALATELNDKANIATADMIIGGCAVVRKDLDEAWQHFSNAAKLSDETQSKMAAAIAYDLLGQVASLAKRRDLAHDSWGKALVRITDAGQRHSERGQRLIKLLHEAE